MNILNIYYDIIHEYTKHNIILFKCWCTKTEYPQPPVASQEGQCHSYYFAKS